MKQVVTGQSDRPHRSPAAARIPSRSSTTTSVACTDNRPEAIAQRKLADAIGHSPYMVSQRQQLRGMFGEAAQLQARPEDEELVQGNFATVQRQDGPEEEEEPLQGKIEGEPPAQLKQDAPRANASTQLSTGNTGLPDTLKAGIESLSGMSMDHVKVHYNSSQPAQLNALAYAQGSDIHLAPGQEQHLPHEAWHVVQQAQGRVLPTMQMKDGVPVNDDAGLEREADVMGAKASQIRYSEAALTGTCDETRLAAQRTAHSGATSQLNASPRLQAQRAGIKTAFGSATEYDGSKVASGGAVTEVRQRRLVPGAMNLVGEEHYEVTEPTRAKHIRSREWDYAELVGCGRIWTEEEFFIKTDSGNVYGDDPMLRIMSAGHAAQTILSEMLNGSLARHEALHSWGTEIRDNASRMPKRDASAAFNLGTQLLIAANHAKQRMQNPSQGVLLKKGSSLVIILERTMSFLNGRLANYLPKTQINSARSRNMLLSAYMATREGMHGIWKVGNTHIDDLNGTDTGKLEEHGVTLTDKVEFTNMVDQTYSNTYHPPHDNSDFIDITGLDSLE